jgi:hypothetical protein
MTDRLFGICLNSIATMKASLGVDCEINTVHYSGPHWHRGLVWIRLSHSALTPHFWTDHTSHCLSTGGEPKAACTDLYLSFLTQHVLRSFMGNMKIHQPRLMQRCLHLKHELLTTLQSLHLAHEALFTQRTFEKQVLDTKHNPLECCFSTMQSVYPKTNLSFSCALANLFPL